MNNKKTIYFAIIIALNSQSFNNTESMRLSSNLININNAKNLTVAGQCYITGINNISLDKNAVAVYANPVTGQLGLKSSILKYKTNAKEVNYAEHEKPEEIDYDFLVVVLINEIKELKKRIEKLESIHK